MKCGLFLTTYLTYELILFIIINVNLHFNLYQLINLFIIKVFTVGRAFTA